MTLIFENSLQFLNTPCFSLENKEMFLTRKCYQVDRAVIILDAVQMMDYPSSRKRFIMELFPNKPMLQYITSPVMCWVVRFIYQNITLFINISTTFPISRMFSQWQIRPLLRMTNEFVVATHTSFRSAVAKVATILAYMVITPNIVFLLVFAAFGNYFVRSFPLRNTPAFMTSFATLITRNTAIYTRMLPITHNIIIYGNDCKCKLHNCFTCELPDCTYNGTTYYGGDNEVRR